MGCMLLYQSSLQKRGRKCSSYDYWALFVFTFLFSTAASHAFCVFIRAPVPGIPAWLEHFRLYCKEKLVLAFPCREWFENLTHNHPTVSETRRQVPRIIHFLNLMTFKPISWFILLQGLCSNNVFIQLLQTSNSPLVCSGLGNADYSKALFPMWHPKRQLRL